MGLLQGVFGSKPTVPSLPPLTLEQEQQKAIAGNLAATPQAEQLVGAANQFSREQVNQMLRAVIPNYDQITQNISGNIASETAGQLPKDVQDAIQNSAAARSLGTGTGGGGMGRNLVARDLGLTSLQLTQQGLSSAESWLRTANAMYAPSMLNLTSMFVSPEQQAAFDVQERNYQFQREWMKSQVAAMPDPVLAGINQEIYGLMLAYVGGGGGGGYSGYKGFGGGGGGGMGMGGEDSLAIAAGGGGMTSGGMAIPAI